MIKAIAKDAFNYAKDKSYHYNHNKVAGKVLSNIEMRKGKTDPSIIKLANQYAEEVLGWRGYAPWLYVYGALRGSFIEGWIPDNYYGKVVVPALKGYYGSISGYNTLTTRLLGPETFPDIAYYSNGLILSKSFEILQENYLKALLFNDSDAVVFKRDNFAKGRGVYVIKKESFDFAEIRALGNGVFQKYIIQNSFFQEFMPSSVGTLRITSVTNDNGIPAVKAAFLRFGRIADTHIQSTSFIRIPININSGELGEDGYLPDWGTIKKHPDTDIEFADKQLPNFEGCKATALKLHERVPFVRAIGWDMTVNNMNEVKVMEWNGLHNDIKFTEATQGPSFSDLGWEKIWCK